MQLLLKAAFLIAVANMAVGHASQGDRIKIGFLVKQPEEPWFQDEWKWAEAAGLKDGFDVVKIGASDGEHVLSAIDALAAQGAKGFVICAPSPSLGPAIARKAAEHGLKFMTVDDRLEEVVNGVRKPLAVPYMGFSPSGLGAQVGSALRSEMQRRAWRDSDTGLLVLTFDALASARARTEGTIEYLTRAGFPKSKVVRVPMHGFDTQFASEAASAALAKHTQVKHWLVAGLNDEAALGAARAARKVGLKEDDAVAVGIGGAKAARDELAKPAASGFWGTILLSPRRNGYETAEMVYKWIKEGIEPPQTTFTPGELVTRSNYRAKLSEFGRH